MNSKFLSFHFTTQPNLSNVALNLQYIQGLIKFSSILKLGNELSLEGRAYNLEGEEEMKEGSGDV